MRQAQRIRYARLMREVESHEATAKAYGKVLAAVKRAAKSSKPGTVEYDVMMEEINRLSAIVDEMVDGAAVAFGAAALLVGDDGE